MADYRIGVAVFRFSILIALLQFSSISIAATMDFKGRTMGTTYSIRIDGFWPYDFQPAFEAIFKDINSQMSTYQTDSEISSFNKHSSTAWFEVSKDFVEVGLLSQKVFRLSDKAFDPTLGSLVNLWGFGPNGRVEKTPSPELLQAELAKVGYHKLEFSSSPPRVRKKNATIYLDFSAVAKGYGVDKVAILLDSLGVSSYLVEIGGEVRTKGRKSDGQYWKIGIESPHQGRPSAVKAVSPKDNALATSGDYRNYFEVKGQRLSHIIDPRIGMPIRHKLASVSVIAKDCAMADALATGFMVLGEDQAMKIAKKLQIAAFFITRSDGKFKESYSPAFAKYFIQ